MQGIYNALVEMENDLELGKLVSVLVVHPHDEEETLFADMEENQHVDVQGNLEDV